MANLPADLRKLLEWLDRVSPLFEAQIVAAGFNQTLDGADAEFCRDEPPRSDRLDHGPRKRCIEQIPRHAPSPRARALRRCRPRFSWRVPRQPERAVS